MEWFEFRGYSGRLSLLSDMKKSDFDKEFGKIWKEVELKQAWDKLQKLTRGSKKTKGNSKEVK